MDYYVNSKTEEETIYEIYKSCRLCGAGAGYKMPIIQNVINLDPDEIELKQKIRECVQIEVHQDDKMPPLVCELCVDKVNDFYEFLEMCKQTNKKTRLRLGLPPQTLPRGAPDAGDCILGVTEPVFINNSNSNQPIQSQSSKTHKTVKIKKDPEPKVITKFRKKDDPKTPKLAESKKDDSKITRLAESKKDNSKITRSAESKKDDSKITRSAESKKDDSKNPRVAESSSLRSGRSRQPTPPPSPPRTLRGTKRPSGDNASVNKIQNTRKPETPPTKSILKKIKVEVTEDLLEPRSKRPRDCTRETIDTPKREQNKKVKVMLNIPKIKVEAKPVPPPPPPPPPPPSHKCPKCKNLFKTPQALSAHMNTHVKVEKVEKPKPLPPPKPEPKPKTQKCTKCDKTFPASAFKGHKCAPKRVSVPECRICKRKFQNTGACTNHEKACKPPANTTHQNIALSDFLTGHGGERACKRCRTNARLAHRFAVRTADPRGQAVKVVAQQQSNRQKLKIPQWLKSQLLPMEVRLMRCDPLCDDNGRCRDASFVDHDYGLDKTREYPYLYNLSMLTHKLRIKNELAMYDRMVKIQDEIRDEFDLDECYTHWDSASESDSDTEMYKSKSKNDIKPLSTLSLKVLFSPKGLGKVPKKLRKIKSEKPFDSILNSTELDSDIKFGINNIINSLEDSINENDNKKDSINDKYKSKDEDALFGENKGPGVKNSDFDSLFGNAGSAVCNKDKLSSNEDVERGLSPTLDLSDVENRLSRANAKSNTENTDKSLGNDSHNKSESKSVDRISSSHASVIESSNNSITLNDEVKENIIAEKRAAESKNDDIEENREGKEHPKLNDNINSNSAVSTIEEHSTEDKEKKKENNEKHNESMTDKIFEDDNRVNKVTDTTINSSHESKIIDYSKRSDCESINNAGVPKENTPQKEVCTEQSKSSRNGDSEFPEKFNADDLEAVSDTDMDDGKLMEAIDEQLGESENRKAIVTDNLSSKVNQESDDFTKDIEF